MVITSKLNPWALVGFATALLIIYCFISTSIIKLFNTSNHLLEGDRACISGNGQKRHEFPVKNKKHETWLCYTILPPSFGRPFWETVHYTEYI